MADKTNGVMARRVEEKLNGLEVMTANLMQNIAYARSELLKKADEYEENTIKIQSEINSLRSGVFEILEKYSSNKNEMYNDLEKLYNGD